MQEGPPHQPGTRAPGTRASGHWRDVNGRMIKCIKMHAKGAALWDGGWEIGVPATPLKTAIKLHGTQQDARLDKLFFFSAAAAGASPSPFFLRWSVFFFCETFLWGSSCPETSTPGWQWTLATAAYYRS